MTSYPEAWAREDNKNLNLTHMHAQTTKGNSFSGSVHRRWIFRQFEWRKWLSEKVAYTGAEVTIECSLGESYTSRPYTWNVPKYHLILDNSHNSSPFHRSLKWCNFRTDYLLSYRTHAVYVHAYQITMPTIPYTVLSAAALAACLCPASQASEAAYLRDSP